jgi:DNA polymerase elongation subunit (family B)
MEFITTDSGRHTIRFDSGYLMFSNITADRDKGYKYMCYAGADTKTTCVSSAKAKKKKYARIVENVNFTVRVKDLKRNDKSAFPKNTISKISLSFLKKLIMENCEGEYLPFSKIPIISKAINHIGSDTDDCDDDPDINDNWDDEEEKVKPKRTLKKGIKHGKKRKLKIKPKVSLKRVKPKKTLKK